MAHLLEQMSAYYPGGGGWALQINEISVYLAHKNISSPSFKLNSQIYLLINLAWSILQGVS